MEELKTLIAANSRTIVKYAKDNNIKKEDIVSIVHNVLDNKYVMFYYG